MGAKPSNIRYCIKREPIKHCSNNDTEKVLGGERNMREVETCRRLCRFRNFLGRDFQVANLDFNILAIILGGGSLNRLRL